MNNDQRNAFVNLTFSVKGQAKRCIDGPTINIPADEFLAGQVVVSNYEIDDADYKEINEDDSHKQTNAR